MITNHNDPCQIWHHIVLLCIVQRAVEIRTRYRDTTVATYISNTHVDVQWSWWGIFASHGMVSLLLSSAGHHKQLCTAGAGTTIWVAATCMPSAFCVSLCMCTSWIACTPPLYLPMYSLLLSTSVQPSGTRSACSWPSCQRTTRLVPIHQEEKRLLNKLEGLPHWRLGQREPHSSHGKVCPHSIPHACHDTMLKLG